MTTLKPKRRRGRPVENPIPERIPDSPENVAYAVLNTRPSKAELLRRPSGVT